MRRLAVLAGSLAFCSGHLVFADAALDELLEADRAFAAAALERGTSAALLEYLAPGAVLFRPVAVDGHEWLADHAPASGRLQWSPAAAAVSCDGATGVTAGPWVYVEPEDSQRDVGYYVSLWRRDGAGGWRVAVDHGVDGAEPDGGSVLLASSFAAQWSRTDRPGCGRGDAKALARAERKLNAALQAGAAARAIGRAGDRTTLVLRDGAAPVPAAQATGLAGDAEAPLVLETRASFAAAGSDIGYSHGEIRRRDAPREALPLAVYLRVWHLDRRQWRLALDMTTRVDAAPDTAAAPPQ